MTLARERIYWLEIFKVCWVPRQGNEISLGRESLPFYRRSGSRLLGDSTPCGRLKLGDRFVWLGTVACIYVTRACLKQRASVVSRFVRACPEVRSPTPISLAVQQDMRSTISCHACLQISEPQPEQLYFVICRSSHLFATLCSLPCDECCGSKM